MRTRFPYRRLTETWVRGMPAAVAAGAALACPTAAAVDIYAGADAAYVNVPVAGVDLGGLALKFRGGATLSSGWGFEIQSLFGLRDDSVGALNLETDNVTAALLRFETNPGGDFRFFAVAGYATTSLSVDGVDADGLDDRFSGFAFGFGAQERIAWLPRTTAVLEANSYFQDSNVDVWSVSFGLRYDF